MAVFLGHKLTVASTAVYWTQPTSLAVTVDARDNYTTILQPINYFRAEYG